MHDWVTEIKAGSYLTPVVKTQGVACELWAGKRQPEGVCGVFLCVCVCVPFCASFKDDKYQEMKDGFESYIYDIYYMVRKGH